MTQREQAALEKKQCEERIAEREKSLVGLRSCLRHLVAAVDRDIGDGDGAAAPAGRGP